MLTEMQKAALIELARRSVLGQVTGMHAAADDVDACFPAASGVFVTLTRDGGLRGCLGTLECRRGLAAEVMRCAADAASIDRRFPPVARHELSALSLEVSVLGPLELCQPPADSAVVIGRHGLVVEQDDARGLLLPQVAAERDWTPEHFLQQTCVKAGLPDDAWRRDASVYRFEAQVFGGPLNPDP